MNFGGALSKALEMEDSGMLLEINVQERNELVGLLENSITETKTNVRRTHNPEWKDGFRQEKELLIGLLNRVKTLST